MRRMNVSFGSRAYVAATFAVMAAAFIAETAVMIWEFGPSGLALPLLGLEAQNFLFFPLGGIMALFAFFRPTVIAVDGYWKGVIEGRAGRFRLILGGLATYVLAGFIAFSFASAEVRSIFEVKPEVVMADAGVPANCQDDECARVSITRALAELRLQAKTEDGINDFIDNCDQDRVTFREAGKEVKYCFVAGRELSVEACCQVREDFKEAVNALYDDPENRSVTGQVHRVTLYFKILFLLTLLGIGIMLATRRTDIIRSYASETKRFALAVPLGAGVMMLWPFLNQAHANAAAILNGSAAGSTYLLIAPLISLIFGIWVVSLLFYYLRASRQREEHTLQVISLAAAGVGVVQFDEIVDWVNTILGIGVEISAIMIFALITTFLSILSIASESVDEDRRS